MVENPVVGIKLSLFGTTVARSLEIVGTEPRLTAIGGRTLLNISTFCTGSTYDCNKPSTPVVLILRMLNDTSAFKYTGVFPWIMLKDEISKIELTGPQRVSPFPLEIKIWEDGMKVFCGVLAKTFRI